MPELESRDLIMINTEESTSSKIVKCTQESLQTSQKKDSQHAPEVPPRKRPVAARVKSKPAGSGIVLRQLTLDETVGKTQLSSKSQTMVTSSHPTQRKLTTKSSASETDDISERPLKSPRKAAPKAKQTTLVNSPMKDESLQKKDNDEKNRPKISRNLFPSTPVAPRMSVHKITTPELEARPTTKPTSKSVAAPKQQQISASFGVRKSSRIPENVKKDGEVTKLHKRILDGLEDPRIEVKDLPGKGRGLVASQPFQRNEFVVEYSGDLVSLHEAKKREAHYASEPDKHVQGCYMYYFKHKGVTKCVDATAETGRYGRLLNHSRTSPNLRTEVIEIPTKKGLIPYLVLRAARDIAAGEELVYDYGDRSPASIDAFPWLKD